MRRLCRACCLHWIPGDRRGLPSVDSLVTVETHRIEVPETQHDSRSGHRHHGSERSHAPCKDEDGPGWSQRLRLGRSPQPQSEAAGLRDCRDRLTWLWIGGSQAPAQPHASSQAASGRCSRSTRFLPAARQALAGTGPAVAVPGLSTACSVSATAIPAASGARRGLTGLSHRRARYPSAAMPRHRDRRGLWPLGSPGAAGHPG